MSYEVKSLNEECGIFGVWGHPEASSVTYFGLHSLQHRGQEGAGIVSNDAGVLHGYRDLGLLSEVFKDDRDLQRLKGNAAIGHVRYATAGNGSVDNIQPFLFKFYDCSCGLAHNGNLTNAKSLRRELEADGAIFHLRYGNLDALDSSQSQRNVAGQAERSVANRSRGLCLYPDAGRLHGGGFRCQWLSAFSHRSDEKRRLRDCFGDLRLRSHRGGIRA